MSSINTELLGGKTYDLSVQMGAKFDAKTRYYVFSRQPPQSVVAGVEFIDKPIGAFAKRLRQIQGHSSIVSVLQDYAICGLCPPE